MFKSLNFRKFAKKRSVAQLFINDGEVFSRYTLLNIPSVLSPETSYTIKAVVKVFSESAKVKLSKEYILKPFESREVFFGYDNNLPKIGVISVEIEPYTLFSKNDSILGTLTPHFYSLFHTRNMDSLGLIHPQTLLNQKGTTVNWKSQLNISGENVEKLVVYQINPVAQSQSNILTLKNENGSVVNSIENDFKPYSANKAEFDLKEVSSTVHLELDRTNTANAKPLVFMYFKDGTFTAVHS